MCSRQEDSWTTDPAFLINQRRSLVQSSDCSGWQVSISGHLCLKPHSLSGGWRRSEGADSHSSTVRRSSWNVKANLYLYQVMFHINLSSSEHYCTYHSCGVLALPSSVHTVSAVELHVKFKGVQHLIWEQITEDFLKRRCRQDFLLKDQSILLSSQFLTNHGTLVEGAIEYWPLVFRSLWFVAINFYDAFFFLSSHLSLEGCSLQVHIPYAKSCRIFLLLKFVCFRNMNHIYA